MGYPEKGLTLGKVIEVIFEDAENWRESDDSVPRSNSKSHSVKEILSAYTVSTIAAIPMLVIPSWISEFVWYYFPSA